VLVVHH
jgi:ubiquitin carboxyl-terminal hydrolase 34